jgi:uncharacterized protein YndB with AHSA1/START domain
MSKEAVRLSCVVPATPHMVYSAWLDSVQHSAFADNKTVVDGDVGGNFSERDGHITGKLVQLDLGRRIIQSWRSKDFPPKAPDSRVELHFESVFGGARITILHSDIPEGLGERVRSSWNEMFGPMRSYFGKMAMVADRASAERLAARASQIAVEQEEEEEEEPSPRKSKLAPVGKGKPTLLKSPVKPTAKTVIAVAAPKKPEPKKPEPKPEPKKPEPKPAAKKPEPKKPEPKPVAKTSAPKPAAKKSEPKPVAKKSAPKPAAKKPEPKPVAKKKK